MDIENLLRSLNEYKVEFVIIGATAFPIHGYARATLDIDLFIRPEPLTITHCLMHRLVCRQNPA
jgi:predicted nucleotidyltransferase